MNLDNLYKAKVITPSDNPIIKDFNPKLVTKGIHFGTEFKFQYNNNIYSLDVYGSLTIYAGGFIIINNTNYKVNSIDGINFNLTTI